MQHYELMTNKDLKYCHEVLINKGFSVSSSSASTGFGFTNIKTYKKNGAEIRTYDCGDGKILIDFTPDGKYLHTRFHIQELTKSSFENIVNITITK